MAQVTELWERTGEVDDVYRCDFTRKFKIHTDNRKTYQIQVLNLLAAPPWGVTIGQRWNLGVPNENTNIYCKKISLECPADGGGNTWIATASYGPADPLTLGVAAIPEAVSEAPVRISWDEWTEPEALFKDRLNQPLLNSAGEPFSEPIDEERTYPTLIIKRYERTFSTIFASQYRNAVNVSSWTIRGLNFPARYARCVSITAEDQWHQLIGLYYEVTYKFAIRERIEYASDGTTVIGQGWDKVVANVGLRQKDGANPLRFIIDPATGLPVTEPVPLNETTGLALSLPLAPTDKFPTRAFRILKEVNYADFSFPVA